METSQSLRNLLSNFASDITAPTTRAVQLDHKKRYLQIAFNHDMGLVQRILPQLPRDDRLLIEAGTPYIKQYGNAGIQFIAGQRPGHTVADLKIADGAVQEVIHARNAGASAVTALGMAATETLDLFVETCKKFGMISMIDMIHVPEPMKVLRPLKSPPDVVVLHRGRDEENTYGKLIQYKQVSKIKSKYDVFISAAGGVDLREAESAVFNGANIVVVNVVTPKDPWSGISSEESVQEMAHKFLKSIE